MFLSLFFFKKKKNSFLFFVFSLRTPATYSRPQSSSSTTFSLEALRRGIRFGSSATYSHPLSFLRRHSFGKILGSSMAFYGMFLNQIASQITDVAGTFGYLAPEYFMYGKVTDKIDVYAFGGVLLELFSGRKPICNELPKGEESLIMWAKPILNGGKVSKLLDPSMGSDYSRDQIEQMVLAATLCIRRAPRARPQMSRILKLLQGDPDVLKWARLQVSDSDSIDRLDEDGLPRVDLQSHLNLALLDVEDDSLSMSSIDQHVSLEEYLRGRWSRSSSFE